MVQADFAAWSLYTGPSYVKNIINHPHCSWIVGQWDGINGDTTKEAVKIDIDHRISAIREAFRKMLPDFKTPNRHFVIPEFFFHCKQGPYPSIKVDDKNYPFEYIVLRLKEELKSWIPKDDTNFYTIIIGSALTSNVEDHIEFFKRNDVINRHKHLNQIILEHGIFDHFQKHNHRHRRRHVDSGITSDSRLNRLNDFMEEARSNPLCTVRNRGAYFYINKASVDEVEVFLYEKQSESSVDLTMGMFNDDGEIITNGMITEWLCNYPSYNVLRGDKQTTAMSSGARFSHSPYGDTDIGVEICLDHYFQRLRRTVDMSTLNGDTADHFPLRKQFIVSGGMQIRDYALAVDCNSIIFNADGGNQICVSHEPERYSALGEYLAPGKYKGITTRGVYGHSIQSQWSSGTDENTYYSHSQLAFTTDDSILKGFKNAKGLNNIRALTYNDSVEGPYNHMTDSYTLKKFPCNIEQNLFALNKGELHHYAPK